MVENTLDSSFMIVFHMEKRVERVITPLVASQAEKMRGDYHAPRIEFDGRAMWDTGSTGCCIDWRFAESLGLTKYGATNLRGPTGGSVSPTYLLDIKLKDGITIQSVEAAAVDCGGAFELVIGMNIISRGDFRLSLINGETVMAFNIQPDNIKDEYL